MTTSKFITNIKARRDYIARLVSKNMEGVGDRFTTIMLKLSIIKLAMAIAALVVMTILFFTRLHVLDPITLHFSRWATSPIICFIILIVAIKFVGLSIGLALTLMSIKNIAFEDIRVRLIGYYRAGLNCFLRKKAQHKGVENVV